MFFVLGGNIYCLKLWGDKSGPYFNALYLFQGVGYLLSPLLAEALIFSRQKPSIEDIANQFEEAILTPLQVLYTTVGAMTFAVAFTFLFGAPADKGQGSYDLPKVLPCCKAIPDNATPKVHLEKFAKNVLIALMTAYCALSNGLAFSFGHFLTTYAVKGPLGLTQQIGSRTTSFYYASQVVMRAFNIFLVSRISIFTLLNVYFLLISIGAIFLVLFPTFWALQLGSVLVGLGAGSLFPMGLLWVQGHMELSSRVASLFCMATTVGAQLLRLTEGAFIELNPDTHVYQLCVVVVTHVAVFVASAVIMQWRERRERRREMESGGDKDGPLKT